MTERKIGVVLSDVDNTQVIHGQKLPTPAVQAAARGLRANGVPLLEVTSRSHALMRKLIEPLDLRDNLCTLDGGATVAHANTGEVVWSRWLSQERARAIVLGIGRLCTNIHYDKESRKRAPEEVLADVQEGGIPAQGAPSVFAIFDVHRSAAILDTLAAIPDIKHTPIMNYVDNADLRCIQVVEPEVDKQYGIEQMLAYGGLTNVRRLVIGDGMNDLSLFAAAGNNGVRVAMGDAPDVLKDLADWIAPPASADGFAVAMEHYGLT